MRQSNRTIAGKAKALGMVMAVALGIGGAGPIGFAQAQDVDLEAVKVSMMAALKEASDVSKEEGKFVLPLRTNAELETISADCERIIRLNDPKQRFPLICGGVSTPYYEIDERGSGISANQS